MGDKSRGEFACPYVVEVLTESGEEGVFGLANVVFIAGGAGDDVNQVAGAEGE